MNGCHRCAVILFLHFFCGGLMCVVFSRLHYVKENLPRSEEDWNKCQFVDKTHWGYYTWPQ